MPLDPGESGESCFGYIDSRDQEILMVLGYK